MQGGLQAAGLRVFWLAPGPAGALRRLLSERLDFHIYTRGQIQLHQRVYRLLGWFQDVQQPLVRPDFKLLPRLLVHVRRAQYRCDASGCRP